ncbi:hypothetical protein HYH02_007946 [Chlamydomonas schloesseri]|uniref:Guanylate cyclase domain-containing protein n=1 Tax=Chlamydomonas schloesseri TaxID=2026947 RepID=A0A835WGV1_9CHLO|nr:hypothetical protein HYH02_007946 [Chlamydomonas schloesseri]|eukprot:KAG2447205.1 hypothetical protein HYH02_007946 [Chlamydomonas schloesseri]
MLVYAEAAARAFLQAAAGSGSAFLGGTDVRLLLPPPNDEVTSSLLFRSYTAYNGRGDAWVADSTTAPCKKGDCRGTRPVVLITRTINSSSSTSSIVTSNSSSGNGAASGLQMGSVDDMQGLPTDLDTAASPPQLLPGSTDLARPQLLMYYRYDVLAALGHPPPATWADLADWAAAVNGTADADGDGKGDYAVCLDFTSSCKAGYLALAMAASMLQPETQAGSFFEPADMSPLVGTVAFEEALRIIQRLVPYSAPPLPARNGSSSCRAFEPAFALGRCLLTINFDQMRATPAPGAVLTAIKNAWDDVVGATATLPASGSSSSVVAFPFVRGALPAEALGVAPLPGSEVMYDRGLCVMVPCSPANCPNAVNTTCAASKTDPGQRRACFVNRAPLVAGLGYEYSASPDADAAILGRLAVLEATAGTALKHWPEALAGTLLIGSSNGPAFSDAGGGTTVNDTANTGAALGRRPRRLAAAAAHGAALRRALQRPVTAADWTNGTGLVQLGYSATEVRRYLDAYWGSLLGQDGSGGAASPGPPRNVVQELAFRGSSYFTNVFAQAVGWVLLGGLSPANASALAAGDTRTLLGLVASNLTRLSYKYSQDIGWSGSRGSHTPPPAGSSSGLSGSQLAAAIAVPVVVTVVLAAALAAAVVVIVRKRKAGGWGAVAPPGAGPGTTLLLTDIQNSTVLWETLPPDVMDAAIRCHHDVLRGLLQPHGGYESATEGDAFILAFHTAEDAASYAVAAQVMLMEAAWPEAMLTHPDCEVVWVSPQRMNPTASLSYVSRELLSALTRAVQTGAAQAGLTLGGGAGGASGGDDANAAPASSKTLMRWLTRFGTSELRSNSSVARSRRKNRSSSDGGNGGSAGGAADGGGGGGDGQPSMGKMKSGFEASIYGRITQANSFRKGKPVPDSRGGGGLSPAASSPLEAMLAQTGNLHPSGMHLGPLSKCPSDIRSYMENEQEGMPDFPSTPRAATAVAAAAAAGGAGGAPASAAALLAAHNGGAVNGLVEPVRSTSVLLPVLPGGCVTVATLTEALRQGWRKVVPGSQSSGAAGAGAATGAVDFGGAAGGLAASSRSGTLDLSNNVAAAAVAAFGAAGAGGGGGVEGEVQQVPEHLLAFRGMRVRMGLHSGADVSEVSLNKATGRTQYSGTFMTEAKAVCDSAHGGQVVLSPTVFKQLPPGCLAKAAFLVHMGEHTLDDYSIAKRQRQQAAAAAAARRRAEGRPSKPRGGRALGLPDLEHLDSAKESGGGSSGGAEAGEEPGEEGGSAPDESEEPDPIPLYQLLPHRLACRLPFFEPLRSHSYLSLGLPDAPVGRVTVAFMYVIGAQALLAWNAPVATEALTLFQNTVASQLNAADGYVVELVDGLCLAAFRSSADALLWALRCGKQLLAAPWSDELLEHELCEEVSLPLHGEWGAAAGGAGGGGAGGAGGLTEGRLASGSGPSGTGGGGGGGGGTPHFGLSRATAIRFKTLMRGLRLKVGMDTGFVADSINATTGRMAYRGRPMNRAARIASKALAGQVHCSAAVWTSAVDRLGVMARAGGEDELTASSLGLQSLKGVMEKIEVLSVSYKGTALSAEEAAVMARHAPRSSHNSVTATSSSNPTVLSGLASAFSLGPGAASSASITAGAATAASGGSITAALSRGSLLNTVLGGGTASPSARNNRSPHVSGGGGLFGGGSTGGAVGGGGGGSGGSSLLPIGVVAPPSAGAGGAGLLLRGSGMRSGTLPPLVTSAEGGAASPLSRTTGYSPQEAPSSPLLGGASASLGAGAAGDALHKEHIVLHLNPLHDTAAGSAVNSGTHALVDSAPVAGISGSFAGAGQQQAAAAAALAHPGAGSAATAAFLLYGSRRVNHGLGPAPAAPAPAAIGLPPRPQSYGGSGGGGGAGGAGAGSPASEGPSAAELTGGDPGTDSPADSPGAGMPARQAPPPGLNRIITFGATVGAAVVEDLNFLAIPPPPPAGAGGAVSGPVAPVAPAPASDTGMSPSAFATSPPPGALLGLQAASSSSAARRGSTGTQLLPGTDSLVSAAGSAGGDGSSRTSQGREHGIDPAAFLAAQQLSINKRDGPAASGQVEVPLDPLSLQVLLDRIEKQ